MEELLNLEKFTERSLSFLEVGNVIWNKKFSKVFLLHVHTNIPSWLQDSKLPHHNCLTVPLTAHFAKPLCRTHACMSERLTISYHLSCFEADRSLVFKQLCSLIYLKYIFKNYYYCKEIQAQDSSVYTYNVLVSTKQCDIM